LGYLLTLDYVPSSRKLFVDKSDWISFVSN
jgi:hypothetical protein